MGSFYIESDPFLKWNPIGDVNGNLFLAHCHEIIFFAFFFHALYLLSPLVNNRIFGKWFKEEASAETRENFNVRVVGIIQAIISVIVCIPMFNHPEFYSNPIGGSYDFAGLIASFTIGYFIWDLFYCCLFHFDLYGFEFLFHAFGALYVFGTTLIPFCQPYLCAFLIYEASTPFVQFHFMMTRAPKGMFPPWAISLNGVFLILVFFVVRIIWGVYATVLSICHVWAMRHEYNMGLLLSVYILNVGFQFLNFTWFSKMITMATRMLRPAADAANADNKAKKID